MTPPFVSALSWAQAYGPGGLTDDFGGFVLPGLFGGAGVVIVIAVNVVPLVYLIVAAGLATRVAPDLERAARAAGAGGREAFRLVTLPLLRPALLGAAALAFVVAVNSFGIPAVLGLPAGFGTMTTRIYQDLARSAAPAAFTRVLVLAAALVVVTVTVVAVADRRFGLARTVVRTAGPVGARMVAGRRAWWPALGRVGLRGIHRPGPLDSPGRELADEGGGPFAGACQLDAGEFRRGSRRELRSSVGAQRVPGGHRRDPGGAVRAAWLLPSPSDVGDARLAPPPFSPLPCRDQRWPWQCCWRTDPGCETHC